MWLHEYGKKKGSWTGVDMVWHTIHIAIPVFRYAFPNCQALFPFDKASNHKVFSDTATKMGLHPGGKQLKVREGFDHNRVIPHAMVSLTTTTSGTRSRFSRTKAMARKWPVYRRTKNDQNMPHNAWAARLRSICERWLLCTSSYGCPTGFPGAKRLA
ncbi:hypothetical protein FN846DRAFT_705602 [Sphaerosporella brunnea]|uniref:Uncharacterized protein n=1 Tax=Sphaerosporella brunnea TaxID=1250544 RepID=A0A5J5EXT7_9PEZI|nr:hypothetical protein FN846DRAFT_705602 [Sphaerosporella brunnea]